MENFVWKYATLISYTSVFLKNKGNTGNLIYFLLLASHVIISPFSRFIHFLGAEISPERQRYLLLLIVAYGES